MTNQSTLAEQGRLADQADRVVTLDNYEGDMEDANKYESGDRMAYLDALDCIAKLEAQLAATSVQGEVSTIIGAMQSNPRVAPPEPKPRAGDCMLCGYCAATGQKVAPAPIAQQDRRAIKSKKVERCHADRDGECVHKNCPQLRDGEPKKSGRHCPLDTEGDEE